MRHRKRTVKFGRKKEHRKAMFASMVCGLIDRGVIITTLAKAKVARPLAEKMVTLGKHGTLHHRRLAIARLRQRDVVKKLFAEVAPKHADRNGGYTRITKLGRRSSDAAEMAMLEWVVAVTETPAPAEREKAEKHPKKEKTKEATAEAKV